MAGFQRLRKVVEKYLMTSMTNWVQDECFAVQRYASINVARGAEMILMKAEGEVVS